MKPLQPNLDVAEETGHVVEYIKRNWKPISNVEGVIAEIRDLALQDGYYQYDFKAVEAYVDQLYLQRIRYLTSTLRLDFEVSPELYDARCITLFDIGIQLCSLARSMRKPEGTDPVGAHVLRRLSPNPSLEKARPLGFEQLVALGIHCTPPLTTDPGLVRAAFGGAAVKGPEGGEFPVSISLTNVLYGEVLNGEKAAVALVGAVYAHFLGIAQYLNTEKLKADLANALDPLDRPSMVFERNLHTQNPILQLMFDKLSLECKTEAAFCRHVGKCAMLHASARQRAKLRSNG